ncbi:MAG: hypothetical protein EA366_08630 [Spirulina sp. DLM2.Bin59]|nr:MAG: hypothetical protein EA366_08630 [Spirulina sp. DLM2.Bin59]
MKYPDWLPYPRYWLKTLLIFVQVNLAFLAGSFAFTVTSLPAFLTSAADDTGEVFGRWLFFWVIAVPIYVFAQCDRVTWHRPKNWEGLAWLPAWRSWFEGIFAYLTIAISIATPSVMIALGSSNLRYRYEPTEDEIAAVMAIAFILSAYIYHVRGLIWRWWLSETARLRPTPKVNRTKTKTQRKPAPKSHRPTSKAKLMLSKPMTDIDREIEELKRKLEGK